MKRGRKPKVDLNDLLDVVQKYSDKFVLEGRIVGPRSAVYRSISEEFEGKLSPSAVYTFIKQNKSAKELYSQWGIGGEEDIDVIQDPVLDDSCKSDSSSDQKEWNNKFTITLSTEEWAQIAPEEYFCKRKDRSDDRVYQVLKPNVWTHTINEHFWLQTKLSCCLVFKRANVSTNSTVYVDIQGFCKDCNGFFHGKILSAPNENARVLIDCKYESRDVCQASKRKRLLRGSAKEKVLQLMIRDNKSASAVRIKEANRVMDHGDVEPSHVPSLNSLRTAKSKALSSELAHDNAITALQIAKFTTPFQESIHDIGLDRFFVHYWTPNQTNVYRQYHRQSKNPTLAIDATGGLVKKLPLPFGNKSGNLFLYLNVATGDPNHQQFPVCQMISEKHSNIAIEGWLQEWLRLGGCVPKTTVCDRSVALLSGIVKAFTQYKSLDEYVNACYKVLFEGSQACLPTCYVRCDVAHVIKNICSWLPLKSMTTSVRSFHIRCMVEIIRSDNVLTLRTLIKSILLVITSPTVGKLVVDGHPSILDTRAETARKYLKNVISNDSFEQLDNDLLLDNTLDDSICGEEFFEDRRRQNGSKSKNPFVEWFKNIQGEIFDRANQEEGEFDNALLCPQLLPFIMQLVEDLPMISNVMRPAFKYGTNLASSARVESTFNQIKNRLFSDKPLPLRVDAFVCSHIAALEGELKLIAASSLPPHTEPPSDLSKEQKNNITNGDEQNPLTNTTNIPVCEIQPKNIEMNEDLEIENWRGQGESTKLNKSKMKSNKSYLIRQSHLYHTDPCTKKSTPLGILKNGNRSSELKPVYLKGCQDKEIRVTTNNTCAFDSVIQILACSYCDSENFKTLCDMDIEKGNKLFKLCKSVACHGITSGAYKQRIEILKEAFGPTNQNQYLEKLLVIQCEVTVSELLRKVLGNNPVATCLVTCTCENCPNIIKETVNTVNVSFTATSDVTNLELKIQDYFQPVYRVCSNSKCYKEDAVQCDGIKTITKTPGDFLFIELVEAREEDTSDITREIKMTLADIPKRIVVADKNFLLRGVVGFSSARKSLSEIGHYVAFAHRETRMWELYDDCLTKCKGISSNKVVEIQVVVYTI